MKISNSPFKDEVQLGLENLNITFKQIKLLTYSMSYLTVVLNIF